MKLIAQYHGVVPIWLKSSVTGAVLICDCPQCAYKHLTSIPMVVPYQPSVPLLAHYGFKVELKEKAVEISRDGQLLISLEEESCATTI